MKKLKHKIKEIYIVWSAKQIMKKVNADKTLKRGDIYIPEETKDKIMAAIHDIEVRDQERKEKERLAEEQELIRLGRIYKRNLHRRKYVIFAAVLTLTLAFGITSFGSVERMFHKLDLKLFNREREVVDTDGIMQLDEITEEEAFTQIEELYGFRPVRLDYRFDNSEFIEMNIHEAIPKISMLYGTSKEVQIEYDIFLKYRESSVSKDVEDALINEYIVVSNGTNIGIQEYLVNNMNKRWLIQFEYEEAYYWISIVGTTDEEIQKVVENLYFY